MRDVDDFRSWIGGKNYPFDRCDEIIRIAKVGKQRDQRSTGTRGR